MQKNICKESPVVMRRKVKTTDAAGGGRRRRQENTHLTYPRDVFVLGLFDHGNESRPPDVARGTPPLLSRSQPPTACCRSERDQGVTAGGHDTLSHRVTVCPANLRAQTAWSDWIQHLSGGSGHCSAREGRVFRVFQAPSRRGHIRITGELSGTTLRLSLLAAHTDLMDWLCIHAGYEYETSQQV